MNFYFIMADPQNDDRMVFHFGRLEPFLKSEEARQSWQYWDPRTGDGTLYFSKAPVCMEKTAKGLIDCWDECISFQDYLGAVLFPQFNNRTVLSCDSYAGSLAAAGQDQTVAVASGTTASGRNAYLTLSAAAGLVSGRYQPPELLTPFLVTGEEMFDPPYAAQLVPMG